MKTSFSMDKPLPVEPETPKPVRQITIVKRQTSNDRGLELNKSTDLAPPKSMDTEPPSTPRAKLTKRKSSSSISRSRNRPSLDRDVKTPKGRMPSSMTDIDTPIRKRVSSPNLTSPQPVNENLTVKKRGSSPNLSSMQRLESSNIAQTPKSPDPRKMSLSQRTKSLTKRISSAEFSRKRQPNNVLADNTTVSHFHKDSAEARTTPDSKNDVGLAAHAPDSTTSKKRRNRKTLGDRTRSLTRRIARGDVLARRKSVPDAYPEAKDPMPPMLRTTSTSKEKNGTTEEVNTARVRTPAKSAKNEAQQNLSLSNRISRGDLLDLRKRNSEDTPGFNNEEAQSSPRVAGQNAEEQRKPEQSRNVQARKITEVAKQERNGATNNLRDATQDQVMANATSNMAAKSQDVKSSLEDFPLQDFGFHHNSYNSIKAAEEAAPRPTSSRRYSLTSKLRRPSLDSEPLRPTSSRSHKLFPGKVSPRTFSFSRKDKPVSKIEQLYNAQRSMSMPSMLQPIETQAPRVPSPDVSISKGQSLHDFMGYDAKGIRKTAKNSDKYDTRLPLPVALGEAAAAPPSPRSPYSLFPTTKDRPKSPRTDSRPATAVPSVQFVPERNPTFTSHPPTLPLAIPLSARVQETTPLASNTPIDDIGQSQDLKPETQDLEDAIDSATKLPQSSSPSDGDVNKVSGIESDVSDSGLGSSPTEIEGYVSSPNTDVFYTPLGSLPNSATLPSEEPQHLEDTKPDSEELDTPLINPMPPATEFEPYTKGNEGISEASEDVLAPSEGNVGPSTEPGAIKEEQKSSEDLSTRDIPLHQSTSSQPRGDLSLGLNSNERLLQLEVPAKESKSSLPSDTHPQKESSKRSTIASPDVSSTSKRFSVPLPHQMKDSDWMNFIPVSGDELSPNSPISPTHLADVAIPRPRPRTNDRSQRRSFPSYKRWSDTGLGKLNPVKEEADHNLNSEGRESIDWRTHSLKNRNKRMSQIKRRPVSELYLRNRALDVGEGDINSSDNAMFRPRSLQLYPDGGIARDPRRLSDPSVAATKQFNRRSAPVSLFSFTSSADSGSKEKTHPIEEALQRLLASQDGESHGAISQNQVADALKALSGEGAVDGRNVADEVYKRLTGGSAPASGDGKIPLCDVSLIKGRASLPSQVARRQRSLSASDLESPTGGAPKLTRSGAQRKRHSISTEPFSTLESRRQSLRQITSATGKGSANSAIPAAQDRRRHSWVDPRQFSESSGMKKTDMASTLTPSRSSIPTRSHPPYQSIASSHSNVLPERTVREASIQNASTPTVRLVEQAPQIPQPPPSRPSTAGATSTAMPKAPKDTKTRVRARTTSLDVKKGSGIETKDHARNFSVPFSGKAAAPPPGPGGRKMVEPKLAPVIQEPGKHKAENMSRGRRKSWWRRIVPGKGNGKGEPGNESEVVKGRRSIDVVEASALGSEGQAHQGIFRGMDQDGNWVLGK